MTEANENIADWNALCDEAQNLLAMRDQVTWSHSQHVADGLDALTSSFADLSSNQLIHSAYCEFIGGMIDRFSSRFGNENAKKLLLFFLEQNKKAISAQIKQKKTPIKRLKAQIFFSENRVTIYHVLHDREGYPLDFWYCTKKEDAVKDFAPSHFDIRELPDEFSIKEPGREAHREAISRAIKAGFFKP